ncbi:JAB domain-containing protein [Gelidibacter gilvus]|uniref:DNA repair protein n=1 Tax=Gelidibacter gilvus TaxID=59602 RepID=A0A4Q0XL84_9FLAO|nr:JAB domain-containing protein [Gelidibacter gilvus]RXJ52635.1 DNA repair protein [Gelidibacter gilvus]
MKVSEIRVSYSNENPVKVKIQDSNSVYELVKYHWDYNLIELQEEVKVVLLNRANVVIGIYELSRGGLTASVVDIKLILSVALKALASSIVLIHNHPSGNLKASEADKSITTKLKQACDIVDISLLDHLIISKDGYLSFKDEGLL